MVPQKKKGVDKDPHKAKTSWSPYSCADLKLTFQEPSILLEEGQAGQVYQDTHQSGDWGLLRAEQEPNQP